MAELVIGSYFRVNFCAFIDKFFALLRHPASEGFFLGDGLFGGVVAEVFGDLHGWRFGWRWAVGKQWLLGARRSLENRSDRAWATDGAWRRFVRGGGRT